MAVSILDQHLQLKATLSRIDPKEGQTELRTKTIAHQKTVVAYIDANNPKEIRNYYQSARALLALSLVRDTITGTEDSGQTIETRLRNVNTDTNPNFVNDVTETVASILDGSFVFDPGSDGENAIQGPDPEKLALRAAMDQAYASGGIVMDRQSGDIAQVSTGTQTVEAEAVVIAADTGSPTQVRISPPEPAQADPVVIQTETGSPSPVILSHGYQEATQIITEAVQAKATDISQGSESVQAQNIVSENQVGQITQVVGDRTTADTLVTFVTTEIQRGENTDIKLALAEASPDTQGLLLIIQRLVAKFVALKEANTETIEASDDPAIASRAQQLAARIGKTNNE